MTDSTVSGNRSVISDFVWRAKAGAISNEGLLAIQSSTIYGNKLTKGGANTDFIGEAGGISNVGEVWANNVTVTANTLIGVKNDRGGRFFIINSLFAGNVKPDLSSELSFDCKGEFVTLRGNTIGDPGEKVGTQFPCTLVDWGDLPAVKPSDGVGRKNFSGPIPMADIFKTKTARINNSNSKFPRWNTTVGSAAPYPSAREGWARSRARRGIPASPPTAGGRLRVPPTCRCSARISARAPPPHL